MGGGDGGEEGGGGRRTGWEAARGGHVRAGAGGVGGGVPARCWRRRAGWAPASPSPRTPTNQVIGSSASSDARTHPLPHECDGDRQRADV